MKKFFYFIPLLMACLSTFTACSDDDDPDVYRKFEPTASSGAYVINQGNFYSKISSSIGYLDYGNGTLTDSVFVAQNGILPGNTLQDAVIHGDYFFAIAYESNVMFITDKNTLKLQKMIPTRAPRDLVAEDGYVYISNYGGYVTRFNARTMTLLDSLQVGPNPEEMALANGYLYVTISDGMNYSNGYANGKKVAKVNLASWKVEKYIDVEVNPTLITADAEGNVFVISMGNYADILSTVQKIDANDKVTVLGNATMMAVSGTTLYTIYSYTNWSTYETVNTYYNYNTQTGAVVKSGAFDVVKYPNGISIDPVTKHLFVTADPAGDYGANYKGAGTVSELDTNGNLLNTYATGVHPAHLVFNVK